MKKYHLCCKCEEPIKSAVKIFTQGAAWCVECWADDEAMRLALVNIMEEPEAIEPPLGYVFNSKHYVDMAYSFTPIMMESEQ